MEFAGPFRPLTEAEHELLSALLGADFQGKAALASQATGAFARAIDPNGSLEIRTRSDERAEVVRRIPVEAELEDADGVTVHVLLHVLDGVAKRT